MPKSPPPRSPPGPGLAYIAQVEKRQRLAIAAERIAAERARQASQGSPEKAREKAATAPKLTPKRSTLWVRAAAAIGTRPATPRNVDATQVVQAFRTHNGGKKSSSANPGKKAGSIAAIASIASARSMSGAGSSSESASNLGSVTTITASKQTAEESGPKFTRRQILEAQLSVGAQLLGGSEPLPVNVMLPTSPMNVKRPASRMPLPGQPMGGESSFSINATHASSPVKNAVPPEPKRKPGRTASPTNITLPPTRMPLPDQMMCGSASLPMIAGQLTLPMIAGEPTSPMNADPPSIQANTTLPTRPMSPTMAVAAA